MVLLSLLSSKDFAIPVPVIHKKSAQELYLSVPQLELITCPQNPSTHCFE